MNTDTHPNSWRNIFGTKSNVNLLELPKKPIFLRILFKGYLEREILIRRTRKTLERTSNAVRLYGLFLQPVDNEITK